MTGNSAMNPFTNDWLQSSNNKAFKNNDHGSPYGRPLNSGFKMQSNSKIFNSTLSTSKF